MTENYASGNKFLEWVINCYRLVEPPKNRPTIVDKLPRPDDMQPLVAYICDGAAITKYRFLEDQQEAFNSLVDAMNITHMHELKKYKWTKLHPGVSSDGVLATHSYVGVCRIRERKG